MWLGGSKYKNDEWITSGWMPGESANGHANNNHKREREREREERDEYTTTIAQLSLPAGGS
jgi:hypothetical protein